MRITPLLAAAILLAACGKKSSPTDPGTQLSAAGIYVSTAGGSVVVFPLTASGNVAPSRKISGASTGLSLPIGLAVDKSGSLYVANRTGSKITVYALGANGDVAPTRALTDTAMKSPQAVYLDNTNDAVYAVTCPNCGGGAGGATGMFHFAAGSTVSDYSLRGSNTGMSVPNGIGIDGSKNIYIGNAFGGTVNVYAPGAQGNTLPIRTITPGAGQNLQCTQLSGNTITMTSPGVGILMYLSTAAASAPPASTIPKSTTLPIAYPGCAYLDTSVAQPVLYVVDFSGNALYVAQTAGSAPNLSVTSVVTISGGLTGLTAPLGIAVVH